MLLNPLSGLAPLIASQHHILCLVLYMWIFIFLCIHLFYQQKSYHSCLTSTRQPHKMKHGSDEWTCFASLQADGPECQQEDCGRCSCRPLRHAGKSFLSALEQLFPAAGLKKNGTARFSAISDSPQLPQLTSSFPLLRRPLVPPTDVNGGLRGTAEQKLDSRLKVQLSYSSSVTVKSCQSLQGVFLAREGQNLKNDWLNCTVNHNQLELYLFLNIENIFKMTKR